MKSITIGQAAKQVKMSTDAIRLYERLGLINKPERFHNGYRRYQSNDIRRLKFIKRAKHMGFTLKEINDLLNFQTHSTAKCEKIKRCASMKLNHIKQQISELGRLNTALEKLICSCEERAKKDAKCPILDELELNDY